MSWYQDGVPDWCTKDELLAANFNIDMQYIPYMSAEQLENSKKETVKEFYNRNYKVVEKILNDKSNYYCNLKFNILLFHLSLF